MADYIKNRFKHYKLSPEGCIDYIQECLYVSMPGLGYVPFNLWDTQKKMIDDIVSCMFDRNKDMYVLLGSRQCGKTTCSLALCDWLTTFFNKYNVVLIHVDDSRGKGTCEEFRKLRTQKCQYMFYKPIKNALTHQIFQNNSSFQLQSTQKSKTGKDVDTGRGLSVNLLWVDEAGSVDLEKLESSIFPTTSTTFMFCKQNNIPHIILLSGTANGRVGIGKKFYDLWCQVEPPKNINNKYMGGYRLFWKDIPGKDADWYASQAKILTPRKLHQEIDCIFYGTENSLFTDDQIVGIQKHSDDIKVIEPNYKYVTPNGYISKGTFYSKLVRGKNYILGADIATGRSQDYTAIEIIDSETLEQIFEFKDNKIQNDDLVKTINNIVLTVITGGANLIMSIEANMTGTAVISDLKALNPIYKTLIYRNTISPDITKISYDQPIDYYKCDYGIPITKGESGTRDLLINYVFKYIDSNISCIRSKELMQEIESLEIDKNGKVVGRPHDDTVFALGHCLLIKNRARKQNVFSIYRYCNDIRNDKESSQHMQLSLQNYDEDIIQDVLDITNNRSSNDVLYGSSGLMSAVYALEDNNEDQYSLDNQMKMMPFSNNITPIVDSSGNLNAQSFSMMREQLLQQSQLISSQVKQQLELQQKLKLQKKNPIIDNLVQKVTKKSKRKTIKDQYQLSDDINNMQMNDDNMWFGAVF